MSADLRVSFGGSIPEYYDRCLGPAWFEPFARELAALVPADPGGDVLEIACGTGLVTRALRERVVASRKLVASDLSKAMLDYSRGKLAPMDNTEWHEADATKLPFRDGQFAAVVCAFGMMFLPDKSAAFSEVRRVLRRDGRFFMSVWDRIEENACALIYAETIESLFPGDEEIRFRLPWSLHEESTLRKYLGAARLDVRRIEARKLPVGKVDARTIATGQVRGTPRGLLLEKKGMSMEDAIDRVTAAIDDYFAKHGGTMTGQAILVEARAA